MQGTPIWWSVSAVARPPMPPPAMITGLELVFPACGMGGVMECGGANAGHYRDSLPARRFRNGPLPVDNPVTTGARLTCDDKLPFC
jgi:hypothetical protein